MEMRTLIIGVAAFLACSAVFAFVQLVRAPDFEPGPFSTSLDALVTGGCGFVGRHFVHRLCELGYHVTVVDNLVSDSALPASKWPAHLRCPADRLTVVQGDCRDYFRDHPNKRFALFVHLAAIVGGRATIEGTPIAVAEDLAIDAAAFKWITEGRNPDMQTVYFSSSAAYPVSAQSKDSPVVLSEDMISLDPSKPLGLPDLTYGWAKLTGEFLAKVAVQKYGLRVAVYRPMSGYGEDQHTSYPFSALLTRALRRDNPISIWSNTTRDLIHVDDIVECVLNTMDRLKDGNAINLATGVPTSFAELAVAMARQLGYNATVRVEHSMPRGVDYRVGSPDRARTLGCNPGISVEQGIARAIMFRSGHTISIARTRRAETARPKYSGVTCTAGNQHFGDAVLQRTPDKFPRADDSQFRVCHFRRVCVRNHELVFHASPDSDKLAPEFRLDGVAGKSLLRLGYRGPAWSPKIVHEPVPEGTVYDPSPLMLFANSYNDNIGHFIFDEMFPQFYALDMFNLSAHATQLVEWSGCTHELSGTSPYTGTPLQQTCRDSYKNWAPAFFDKPATFLPEMADGCFTDVVAGQSSAFSLSTLDVGRGGITRRIRTRVVHRLGVQAEPGPHPEHRILVQLRGPGYDKTKVESICDTVKRILSSDQRVRFRAEVRCELPAHRPLKEQVEAAQWATVIVAEHGTVSHAALFSRDGTSLVSIGGKDLLKEPQILLFSTHFSTFYAVREDQRTIADALMAAMLASVEAFGVPRVEGMAHT